MLTPPQSNEKKSPQQILEALIEGNKRFTTGMRSIEPMFSHLKMPELADKGQKPQAVILTCSDSRCPAEMIFDQGIGQLFVIRVAGNVIAPSLLASIEFGAINLGCSLILVMGHTLCGAIQSTIDHVLNPSEELPSPHLEELVSRIRPAVEKVTTRKNSETNPKLVDHCIIENIKRSATLISEQSSLIRSLVAQDKLLIKGAVLDIRTGSVELI